MPIEFIAQKTSAVVDLGTPSSKPTATTADVVEATKPLWNGTSVEVGLWECSPGSFRSHRDGYTEICQFLSGSVTIETTGGGSTTLGAGDTLVMPSGWRGVWHVHEAVRKTYITIDD